MTQHTLSKNMDSFTLTEFAACQVHISHTGGVRSKYPHLKILNSSRGQGQGQMLPWFNNSRGSPWQINAIQFLLGQTHKNTHTHTDRHQWKQYLLPIAQSCQFYNTETSSRYSSIFLQLTGAKLRVRVSSLASGFVQLVKSPSIVLKVLVVLWVDSIDLALSSTCSEQRSDKELSKSSRQTNKIKQSKLYEVHQDMLT